MNLKLLYAIAIVKKNTLNLMSIIQCVKKVPWEEEKHIRLRLIQGVLLPDRQTLRDDSRHY